MSEETYIRSHVAGEIKGLSLDTAAVLALCGEDQVCRDMLLKSMCADVALVIALSAASREAGEAVVVEVAENIAREVARKLMKKNRKPVAA